MNMECTAKKYDGSEISLYCAYDPEDAQMVWPILERLTLEGIRLWYETGDEAEAAARQLEKSSAGLIFLSQKAADNHSVLNKLIYLTAKARPVCYVKLDDGNRTAGLMVLMAGKPRVAVSGSKPSEAFYQQMLQLLEPCRDSCVRPTHAELLKWVNKWYGSGGEENPLPAPPSPPAPKPQPPKNPMAVLVRCATGECYPVRMLTVEIGRETQVYHPDIAIIDQTGRISRHHAMLTARGGQWYLQDDNSMNGTYVGVQKQQIRAKECAELHSGTVFFLNTERFVFCCGDEAKAVLRMNRDQVLQCYPDIPEPAQASAADSSKKTGGLPGAADGQRPGFEAMQVPHVSKMQKLTDATDMLTESIQKRDTTIEELEKTVSLSSLSLQSKINENEKTLSLMSDLPAALIRQATGEYYLLDKIENIIGRASPRRLCNIALTGNPSISREHAAVFRYGGKFLIRDCGSLEGTFIGEQKVPEKEATELYNGTWITIAGEDFLFVLGDTMTLLQSVGKLCVLQNLQSKEKRLLGEKLFLDRNHPWKDGLLNSPFVSRNEQQTVVYRQNGTTWIRDLGSTNGTWLNGQRLDGQAVPLTDQMVFRIGKMPHEVVFSYTESVLKAGGESNE